MLFSRLRSVLLLTPCTRAQACRIVLNIRHTADLDKQLPPSNHTDASNDNIKSGISACLAPFALLELPKHRSRLLSSWSHTE